MSSQPPPLPVRSPPVAAVRLPSRGLRAMGWCVLLLFLLALLLPFQGSFNGLETMKMLQQMGALLSPKQPGIGSGMLQILLGLLLGTTVFQSIAVGRGAYRRRWLWWLSAPLVLLGLLLLLQNRPDAGVGVRLTGGCVVAAWILYRFLPRRGV